MDNSASIHTMRHDVVILGCGALRSSDVRAAKLVTFLGVEPTFVSWNGSDLEKGSCVDVPPCHCLIVDAGTLIQATRGLPRGEQTLHFLAERAENIFVYGFKQEDDHGALLRLLSGGTLTAVGAVNDDKRRFRVSKTHRDWCCQFSGLSLGNVEPRIDRGFVETEAQPAESLIWIGDQPFVVHGMFDAAHLILSGCGELADLDEDLARHDHISTWFSRLFPVMMFLRKSLGDRVWHNNTPRACFMIDDPLLRERHGFLEMRPLLESIRQLRSFTSIAFVPWNYDRSNENVADLFSSEYCPASLCVHGCDHSRGEFAGRDVTKLTRKAQLALRRMEEHRTLYGADFDPVMVFPQGLFSPEAITALKISGYLAAINSDPQPSNPEGTLKLRELLDGAVNRFSDFPVFVRRYPHDALGFAFDLFLGKPAFAVEHHTFFQHGYQGLETFVAQLRSMDERIEWASPMTICSTACLIKTAQAAEIHVRFWTNQFQLTNREPGTRSYILLRDWAKENPLPSVNAGGVKGMCERWGEQLAFRVTLNQGESLDICLVPQHCAIALSESVPLKSFDLRVRVRRLLCEFRDNHIDTNILLSRIAWKGRALLRAMRSQMGDGQALRERVLQGEARI